ncbi:hypothetical protein MLD38_010947 [Melastoma candidum]|uniref:Uncharacterized protein n=1 Tax=Melastoma candidum TaxID=119954 RepID=A0ACB9R0Z2_9MYRT|nr:hypothetical protein MLD38_010947 [Melastoma candidum]
MNDKDVSKQIQQMVPFASPKIEEKVNVISVATEEECNIEKIHLVEAEKKKIRPEGEQQEKQTQLSLKEHIMALQYREDDFHLVGAAGASSLPLIYSLDLARNRLADVAKVAIKGGEGLFTGLFDLYRNIIQFDGIVGLSHRFNIFFVGIMSRGPYLGILTYEGSTNLEQVYFDNQIAQLMVEQSRSQDYKIKNGTTTGVVVLVGFLHEQAKKLLKCKIYPIRITGGYVLVSGITIGNPCKQDTPKIAFRAASTVADLEKKDVNVGLMKVEVRPKDTELVTGIIIDKDMRHPQMPKKIEKAEIAMPTSLFESPKLMTRHKAEIDRVGKFQTSRQQEQKYFNGMVQKCKNVGTTFVIYQWGCGDEANVLLIHEHLPVAHWIDNVELKLTTITIGGRIVPRSHELAPDKHGEAGLVSDESIGATKEQMMYVEHYAISRVVSIFIRGGNKLMIKETKCNIHDALCIARDLVHNNSMLYGGSSARITNSVAAEDVDRYPRVEQYVIGKFTDALDSIPMTLTRSDDSDSTDVVGMMQIRRKEHDTMTSNGLINVVVFGGRRKVILVAYPGSLCICHVDAKMHELGAKVMASDVSVVGVVDLANQIVEVIDHFELKEVLRLSVNSTPPWTEKLFNKNCVLKSVSFPFEYIRGNDYIYAMTSQIEDAFLYMDKGRQMMAPTIKHVSLEVAGLGCEDALIFLFNYAWLNIFETFLHFIIAVMEAIEGMWVALRPVMVLNCRLQGLFYPARKHWFPNVTLEDKGDFVGEVFR